jgi:redox-sensitive bicupin YhaK (pirin superfamily)
MIALRRAEERHHDRGEEQEVWRTFRPENGADSFADRFGPLAFLDEGRLAPGGRIPRHPARDGELLTYVREGSVSHDDSLGGLGVIHAGDFQRITAARGRRLIAANASKTGETHVFQIGLRPSSGMLAPAHEQKRFRPAERRGVLRLVASPDGRGGSLHVRQDAFLYSAVLDPGRQVIHPLARDRLAWLHVVHGKVAIGELVLATGDGLGVSGECAISLTAQEQTELLLLDLRDAGALKRISARRAPVTAATAQSS